MNGQLQLPALKPPNYQAIQTRGIGLDKLFPENVLLDRRFKNIPWIRNQNVQPAVIVKLLTLELKFNSSRVEGLKLLTSEYWGLFERR